jgi:CBS-domain-containing membrane protein
MQAKDIMTTSVISVPQDGKIEDAVRLMLDHHVSARSCHVNRVAIASLLFAT